MRKFIDVAIDVLKISESEAINNSRIISENAVYFWQNQRSGLSVIVASDGTYLAATSGVGFDKHLEEFNSSRRN